MLSPLFLAALLAGEGTPRLPLGAPQPPPVESAPADREFLSAPRGPVRVRVHVDPPAGYRAEDFVAAVRGPGSALSRRALYARGRRLRADGAVEVPLSGPATGGPSSAPGSLPGHLVVLSDDGLLAARLDPTPPGTEGGPDGAAGRSWTAHPVPAASLDLDVRLAPNPREDLPNGDWSLAQERGPVVELVRVAPEAGYAGTFPASTRESLGVPGLPPGRYRARVWADAYEPTEVEVELTAGQRTFAAVELLPLAPDRRGDLRVRYVFADGPPHGMSRGPSADAPGRPPGDPFAVEVRSTDTDGAAWSRRLPSAPCGSRASSEACLKPVAGDGPSALSFTLRDLPTDPVVVRTDPPAEFTVPGQVLVEPGGAAVEVPVRRKPGSGFGFRVLDVATGRELRHYTLSAARARAAFPLPLGEHVSSEPLVEQAPPPGVGWRIDAPGFAPAFGFTDAFSGEALVTVELQPGWGTELEVRDVEGRPLADVELLADGARVAVTDRSGRARLTLPSRPGSIEVRHRGWVRIAPRPDQPADRIVLAPPLEPASL